jgi:hypothetical protein
MYLCLFTTETSAENPNPIQFSIPSIKIVKQVPKKTRDFAFIVPGKFETYIYDKEEAYYADYQQSYFAITQKKAGWDCMRHYEILANGCIPYFLDIDKCPENIMYFLPKELIKEAMALKGVYYLHIDHAQFDRKRYFEILHQLLEYVRSRLTTKNMAQYILDTVNYTGEGNILFLSNEAYPDYLRCLTLIGLKEIYHNKVVDYPKIEHIYTTSTFGPKELYGKGFSYSKIIDDEVVNRDNIAQRIVNNEFDLIVYGSVHRGFILLDLVLKHYSPEKIIYLCGEDAHYCQYAHDQLHNLFVRELPE